MKQILNKTKDSMQNFNKENISNFFKNFVWNYKIGLRDKPLLFIGLPIIILAIITISVIFLNTGKQTEETKFSSGATVEEINGEIEKDTKLSEKEIKERFGSCSEFYNANQTDFINCLSKNDKCNFLTDVEEKSLCKETTIFQEAVNTYSLETCGDIENVNRNENCKKMVGQLIKKTAKEIGDETLCDGLLTFEDKNSCTNSVILQKAKTTNNPTLCDGLKNKKDKEACTKQFVFEQTLSEGTSDSCKLLKGIEQKKCVYQSIRTRAIKNLDYKICKELKTKKEQLQCSYDAIFAKAAKTKDSTQCKLFKKYKKQYTNCVNIAGGVIKQEEELKGEDKIKALFKVDLSKLNDNAF